MPIYWPSWQKIGQNPGLCRDWAISGFLYFQSLRRAQMAGILPRTEAADKSAFS
jgi:hypothetical protein